MKRKVLFVLLVCVLTAWSAGCALAPTATAPTATPAPTRTPAPLLLEGMLTFTRYDGKKYSGMVHGHGKTAIIMANMAYGDETQWAPFVDAFDKDKFTAITFNYLQQAQGDYAAAENEVQTILDTLKSFGFKRVVCMGASMGLSACTYIAQAPEMVGIVAISGPNYGGTLDTSYPKLFISGKLDQWSAPTESEYNRADEPKTLILYPGIAHHGTDIFYSSVKDQFLKSLLDFVNNIQYSQLPIDLSGLPVGFFIVLSLLVPGFRADFSGFQNPRSYRASDLRQSKVLPGPSSPTFPFRTSC
jgi:hypothetical protein